MIMASLFIKYIDHEYHYTMYYSNLHKHTVIAFLNTVLLQNVAFAITSITVWTK